MPTLRSMLYLLPLLAIFSLATTVVAETSTELRTLAQSYQATIREHLKEIAILGEQTTIAKQKSNKYQVQVEEAKQALEEAKANLASARTSTADNAIRQQELATRRVELAKHALSSREGRLERASAKSQSTAERVLFLRKAINQMKSDIPTLRARADKLETQEIRAAQQEKAAALAAAATPPPVATPEPTPTSTPEPAAIQFPTADGDTITLPYTAVIVSEDLSSRQKYARTEVQKLIALIRDADLSDEPHRGAPRVNIDGNKLQLSYVGAKQYYAEVVLPTGKHTIGTITRQLVATVPESANDNTFVVIVDTSKSPQGRLVFFNKNHL